MRRPAILSAVICSIIITPAIQAAVQEPTGFRRHFVLKATGGMNRLRSGDWNEFLNSHKNGPWYFSNLQQALQVKDNYREQLRWARGGEVELSYVFHPNYSVSLGSERFQGDGKFGYVMDFDTGTALTGMEAPLVFAETRHERVNAVVTPIYLTFYTRDRSYPFTPYVGIGVGHYTASYVSESDYSMVSNFSVDVANITTNQAIKMVDQDSSLVGSTRMKAATVGFHAVIGTEYYLNRSTALIAEVKGRYAKISGFNGSKSFTVNGDRQVTEEGELTALSEYLPGVYTRHVVELDARPQGEETLPITPDGRARRARMDFSGVSLRLGLSYRF